MVAKRALLLLSLLIPVALAGPIHLGSGGTPLSGAVVEVEKLDGTRLTLKVGADGTLVVREVPLGILRVKVVSWKGVPIGYECVVTPSNYSIDVPGIYRLTVVAVGARGQGLAAARVRVLYEGKVVEEGVTDESGSFSTLLPQADYSVVVEYGGRVGESRIELREPIEVKVMLDVFAVVGGYPLSSAEFMGLIALVAILALGLYLAAYEYSEWRRRRLLRPVARPTPSV